MHASFRQRLHELRQTWRGAVRRHPIAASSVVAAFAIVAVLSFAGGIWLLTALRSGLPDQDAIGRIGEMDQATAVYDDGDRLAFTIYKEQRIEVPLSEISPNLVRAVLAIEDQRFYEHRGFDTVRIASAVLANLRLRRAAQGGSTIT